MKNLILIAFGFSSWLWAGPSPHYPASWWKIVPRQGAPAWEILPQEAGKGEVILSKRNELGILSNFAPTPFVFKGKRYASVEGFWQATKYPEEIQGAQGPDPRIQNPSVKWPYARHEVEVMTSFAAKAAGDLASRNMEQLKINWVSYEGHRYTYKKPGESAFYHLIVSVMRAKLEQNPRVREILLSTGDLKLRPDHLPGPAALKAWQYHEIWMMLRKELQGRAVTSKRRAFGMPASAEPASVGLAVAPSSAL